MYEASKEVNCIYGVPGEPQKVFDLIDKLWDTNYKLYSKIAPVPLQVVEVTTSKHILKPMIVLKLMGNKCICLFTEKISDSWPL